MRNGFSRIVDGKLVKADGYAVCHFYECYFNTANGDREGMGIVPFFHYVELNGGGVVEEGNTKT